MQTPPTPRILLFTGNGKGKTTAALGMALRASGHGWPILVLHFVKSNADTGEWSALNALPNVSVHLLGRGFIPRKSSPEWQEHAQAAVEGLRLAAHEIASDRYRMVILDELCTAVMRGLLDEQPVIQALRSLPEGIVVVLTGRGATSGLIDLADTVTEMRCIKHDAQNGRDAQPGVEF